MKLDFLDFNQRSTRSRRHPTEEDKAKREAYRFWTFVIRALKAESKLPHFDDAFDAWLLEKYQIKILHDDANIPLMITGIEVDDDCALLIKLKFSDYAIH